MTFKQAQEMGANVRKGERGTLVVYAGTLTRTDLNEETGEEDERGIPFLKSYSVFNADQIEGLPAKLIKPQVSMLDPSKRIEQVDRFVVATGAEVRTGGTGRRHLTFETPPETFGGGSDLIRCWREGPHPVARSWLLAMTR